MRTALTVCLVGAVLLGRPLPPRRPRPPTRRAMTPTARSVLTATGVAVAVLAVVPGVVGLPLAALAGAAVLRRRPAPPSRPCASAALAADLVAACVRAAVPVGEALTGVGALVGGQDGAELVAAGTALDLAAPAGQVLGCVDVSSPLVGVVRAAVLARDGGAGMAQTCGRVAAGLRARSRAEADVEARAAAVRATLPLALCTLPAFVLIAVVPTVVGLAAGVRW